MGIYGNTNMNRDIDFLDILNIFSFYIGMVNLSENRAQSAYNDVHAANSEQLEQILRELDKRFEEQNAMLQAILEKVDRP